MQGLRRVSFSTGSETPQTRRPRPVGGLAGRPCSSVSLEAARPRAGALPTRVCSAATALLPERRAWGAVHARHGHARSGNVAAELPVLSTEPFSLEPAYAPMNEPSSLNGPGPPSPNATRLSALSVASASLFRDRRLPFRGFSSLSLENKTEARPGRGHTHTIGVTQECW